MCFPCGLSDNLKPRSRCSNSLAGISGSAEAQACWKSTSVAPCWWRRTDFTEGTLPAWDRRHVLGFRRVISPQDAQLLKFKIHGCNRYDLWVLFVGVFCHVLCISTLVTLLLL